MGFDFVRPFAQAGILDERLPAGLRQILASKTDFRAVSLQNIGTTAV